jgi:hypothetical protein
VLRHEPRSIGWRFVAPEAVAAARMTAPRGRGSATSRLRPWQGSRLPSASETSASLQMPTGWTGSAAIASAVALTGRGPVS